MTQPDPSSKRERRRDLSPDGRHLIYFAMNGRWQSSAKGAWTAISRARYLKAVSLFAKGDCWHGGGLFQTSSDYWLNDGCGHEVLEEDRRLRSLAAFSGLAAAAMYVQTERLRVPVWLGLVACSCFVLTGAAVALPGVISARLRGWFVVALLAMMTVIPA